MPPSVFYVFKRYLYLVRLIWPGLVEDIAVSYDAENSLIHIFLSSSDYFALLSDNLTIVFILVLVIIIAWICLAIFDKIGTCTRLMCSKKLGITKPRANLEPTWNNFALRFFYELFLEFCICALVNIEIFDFSRSEWIISLFVLIMITVYIAWLVSLFFFNGPFLQGFYTKGTVVKSLWNARKFDVDFGATQKVEAIKKAKK